MDRGSASRWLRITWRPEISVGRGSPLRFPAHLGRNIEHDRNGEKDVMATRERSTRVLRSSGADAWVAFDHNNASRLETRSTRSCVQHLERGSRSRNWSFFVVGDEACGRKVPMTRTFRGPEVPCPRTSILPEPRDGDRAPTRQQLWNRDRRGHRRNTRPSAVRSSPGVVDRTYARALDGVGRFPAHTASHHAATYEPSGVHSKRWSR